jgi:Bacteriocin-protection, YdeI or OmpD-Associated/Domain of unknown function (DUF1905)
MAGRVETSSIRFHAVLLSVGTRTLLRLPEVASRQLPSRGQVSVRGTVNGHDVRTVLEPDGARGHWMTVDPGLRRAVGAAPGDTLELELETTADWPEPDVPADLAAALEAAPTRIQDVWEDITPMARWEWVRWVNATGNPATRQRRVEVSISKIDGGKRRPCCFDLASCTDPDLSRNGRLVDAPLQSQP